MVDQNNNRQYRTIQEFEMMRWGITIVVMTIILAVSIFVSVVTPIWLSLAVFAILSILFVWDGFIYFPDNPAVKWVPEVLGVSVNLLKPWGPVWLPCRSKVTIGFTEMPGGSMHADIEPKEMVPGDNLIVRIPVHLFYSISEKNPMQIFLVGGLENAKMRLLELIGKTLRQWITTPEKGPEALEDSGFTLNRVRQMSNEAINYILEELVRDDITAIPPEVPTEALIGYFEGRFLSPREKQLVAEYQAKPLEEREVIRKLIEERMSDINKLRTGQKGFLVESIGLVISMMVVDNIEPDGTSIQYLAEVAKARQEAIVGKVRAQNLADQAALLKPVTNAMDPLRAVLISIGNIKENIDVRSFETSPELLNVVTTLGQSALRLIASRMADGKENSNGGSSNPGA